MKNNKTKKLILSAFFLALGIVLPYLTALNKEIGDSLLPMHIPVMLTSLYCGSFYGFAVGLVMPFIKSLISSMPPLYPNAVWMATELLTYGFMLGFLTKKVKNIYISLIVTMLLGRATWGIAKCILLGVGENGFTLTMFIMGGFVDSLLGIIIQLILIPLIWRKNKNERNNISLR